MATTKCKAAILVREVPIEEGNVWWTDVDKIQQRLYDTAMVEPYVPETKRYSYNMNISLKQADVQPVNDQPDDRRHEDNEDNSAVAGSASSGDLLADDDDKGGIIRRITESKTNWLRKKPNKQRRNIDVRQEWKEAWKDYRLHCAIHGVRHALQPQPFALRRFLWTTLLLAMAAIFGYCAMMSVRVYVSRPTLLYLEEENINNITFPAVTLCNLNKFRFTAAVDNGWLDMLSELFSTGSRFRNTEVHVYNLTNTSMFDVYNLTSYRKQDTIVECTWNGITCTEEDFDSVYNTQGICYTFNRGRNTHIRHSTETGIGTGLSLVLNSERYEYLAGPTPGAALRVFIHQQNEMPFRYNGGIILSEGSYSFFGVKHRTVNLLPGEGGTCVNDDDYRIEDVIKCSERCKQRYLCTECGCSMPQLSPGADNESCPYCTISQYATCAAAREDGFISYYGKLCNCPASCVQRTTDVHTSLTALANTEITELIQKYDMRNEYIKAQRREFYTTLLTHTHVFQQFVDVVKEVNNLLNKQIDNLREAIYTLRGMLQTVDARIEFHYDSAFSRLSSYLNATFMDGWKEYKRLALSRLSVDIYEMADQFRMTMSKLDDPVNETVIQTLWMLYDNKIRERIELTKNAEKYITGTYDAFITGTPLISDYKETINGYFDRGLIDIDILASESRGTAELLRKELIEAVQSVRTSLGSVFKIGNNYIIGKSTKLDKRDIRDAANNLIASMKSYRERLAQFENGIINTMNRELSSKVNIFLRANDSLHEVNREVIKSLQTTIDLIRLLNFTTWKSLLDKANQIQEYLSSPGHIPNIDLIHLLSHNQLQLLDVSISDLLLQNLSLTQKWTTLSQMYQNIWLTMLHEPSLQMFYKLIATAFQEYLKGVQSNKDELIDEYSAILADVLRILPYQLKQLDVERLRLILNADFSQMKVDRQMSDITDTFKSLTNSTELTGVIFGVKEKFRNIFRQYQIIIDEYMQKFNLEKFYRKNIVKVNIFVRTFVTETKTQKTVYGYVQLLGNLGGLLSLFLGASIISIIEPIDLLLRQLSKWITSRDGC